MLTALALGCADTRGPKLIVNSHLDYNRAVSQVLEEELLLNIVRRRYMEAPQFLLMQSPVRGRDQIKTNLCERKESNYECHS